MRDPAINNWSTELENILRQSTIEQESFEFKIGFYNLGNRLWNKSTFTKSIKTLTAMANKGRNCVGYVIIGIADKKNDALKLQEIDDKYSFVMVHEHYITGIEHDVDFSGLSADRYFQRLIQLINNEPIDDAYKGYINKNIRFIKYNNKNLIVLKIKGLSQPANYGENYYERIGNTIKTVPPTAVSKLLGRF